MNSMRSIYEYRLTPFRCLATAARAKYFHLVAPTLQPQRGEAHYHPSAVFERCLDARDSLLPSKVGPRPFLCWWFAFRWWIRCSIHMLIHKCNIIYNMSFSIPVTCVRYDSQNDRNYEVLEIGQVDPSIKKAVHCDNFEGLADRVQQNSQWQSIQGCVVRIL